MPVAYELNNQLARLNTAEILIRRALNAEGASPFLAHWELSEEDREKFVRSFRLYLNGRAEMIPQALRKWPLFSVWNFAHALSSGYGVDSPAVYAHLERAFGVSLVGDVRNVVSDAFRSVCRRYGLCFDGGERKVNDYLAQAGISRAQLHHVARAFLLAERAYGPPPFENTAVLNSWEDDAAHFLPVGVNIPRMVLYVDETAHYASLFARFRRQEAPRDNSEKQFFEEISKAKESVSAGGAPAVPRPLLIWTQNGLALSLPKVEGRLGVSIGGRSLRLRGAQKWELPTPWPAYVEWVLGEHSETMPVVPSARQLLVFEQETGRLLTSVDADREQQLFVDGREVIVVSSSAFHINDEPAFHVGEGYAAYCLLDAAAAKVAIGARTVSLRAKPKPRIWLETGAVASGPKGPLISPRASLAVELGELEGDLFDLSLSVGSQNELIEIIKPANSQHVSVEIPEALHAGQNVSPLKVELRLHQSQRALVRYRAWLWQGLREFRDGFVFESDSLPANYNANLSRHIVTDDSGRLALDLNGAYESATLAFAEGPDRVDFSIPRPGISLTITDVDGQVSPLKIGEKLIVREEDKGGSLRIRCPEPSAALTVRGRYEPEAFKRSPTRVLSFADLLTPASADEIVVQKSASGSVPISLVQVVPAACPKRFSAERVRGALEIQLEMEIAIDAIRFSLEDERGRREEFDYALADKEVPLCAPHWLRAGYGEKTGFVAISLDVDAFAGDLTLASLAVRRENTATFRPLRNLRGDNYAVALGNPSAIHDDIDVVEDTRHRFLVINEWMARCYAPESWDYVGKRIYPHWAALGKRLATTPEGRALLISAAHVLPPPGSPKSWIPLVHPLKIFPELYGAPFSSFVSSRKEGLEVPDYLSVLGEAADRSVIKLHQAVGLSVAYLRAFEDVSTARGFAFNRYVELYQQLNTEYPEQRWFWRLGDELLGPAHYSAALTSFIDRLYEAGLEDEGANDVRIRHAATVANWAARMQAKTIPVPAEMELSHGIIELVPSFISGFARASRHGAAAQYLDALAANVGQSVVDDASFMVRLAPELLTFYLLFWELGREQ
ncbi:hypothetical protein R2G56_04935 [Nitratireductor aquimarinus]|uniref:Uncharacterized protein n=1 Tax=Nitratireductor aquimarinus TaxID=889300 RepID=A0ABU4AHA7_9HYPH|nr:hypothetical protein [Nitratireductor aquimarinus]MDV6225625.1 hypothetical protein [Nitratireductor aquimarinus]